MIQSVCGPQRTSWDIHFIWVFLQEWRYCTVQRCKVNRETFITKKVGICMILSIPLTDAPKYIFLPVIHIMDIALVGSNNYVNRKWNYLLLIPLLVYLLVSLLCSQNDHTRIESCHPCCLRSVLQFVLVVFCDCILSISPQVANVHVWIYTANYSFIMGSL